MWFDGRTPGDAAERAFVDRVRELAPDAMGDRVSADDTGLFPYGCLVTVDVPGVPANEVPVYTHQLQVLFAPGLLGGYWGCSHLWDGFDPADLEALYVTGDVTPQEAAEAAVRWMAHQLHRPLVVQEWDNRLSGTKTRRWVLVDTGRLVAGKRRVPRRRPVPSRVVSLWPPGG